MVRKIYQGLIIGLVAFSLSCGGPAGPELRPSGFKQADVDEFGGRGRPPEMTKVGKRAYVKWFSDYVVSDKTRAFIQSHTEALADVMYKVQDILKPIEGAEIMTRKNATFASSSHLKTPESVEEKIYREWMLSTREWEGHNLYPDKPRGAFPEGVHWLEARELVFNADPRDRFAVRDVAGLRVLLNDLDQIQIVMKGIVKTFGEDVVKSKNFYTSHFNGSGYRAVHIVVQALGKPVEIQLRTRALHDWAGWQYKLVYKGRYKNNPEVFDYCVKVSDQIFAKEEGRCADPCVVPECPQVLIDENQCYKNL
jgi:Region found in RelA / SpoT proteins